MSGMQLLRVRFFYLQAKNKYLMITQTGLAAGIVGVGGVTVSRMDVHQLNFIMKLLEHNLIKICKILQEGALLKLLI